MSATLTLSPKTVVLDTPPAPAAKPSAVRSLPRLDSLDLLRGLAMIVMALDHTRDFFSSAQFDPEDLDETTPALFFTRWITHFCAPIFIFLAGTSVYLSGQRGKSKNDLAVFLLTRGLWLVFLELTLLRLGMVFSFDYHWVSFTVLWAIGWSMVALSALIYLPLPLVGAFGVMMILSHNLFDGVIVEGPRWAKMLWATLHGPPKTFHTRAVAAHIMYPLVPWVGVMAAGYAFGSLLSFSRATRRKIMVALGVAVTLAFVGLRALNVYGDPDAWAPQGTTLYTVMSFLCCAKYPPSLLFLLMTLGPAIALLALLDRDWRPGPAYNILLTYGRVPLFYFLIHWYLIHTLAVVAALVTRQPVAWMFEVPPFEAPINYGFDLPFVYATWIVVVVSVYPACLWFARLKQRRKDLWWLSYF